MSDDVRFEDQGEEFGSPPTRGQGFDMSGMLVKWGLVSSRQEAQYVLVAVAAVSLVAAAFFFFSSSGGGPPPPPPPNMAPSSA